MARLEDLRTNVDAQNAGTLEQLRTTTENKPEDRNVFQELGAGTVVGGANMAYLGADLVTSVASKWGSSLRAEVQRIGAGEENFNSIPHRRLC